MDKVELRAGKVRRRYSSIALCGLRTCSRMCTGARKVVWQFGSPTAGKAFAVQFCSEACQDEVVAAMVAGRGLRLKTAVGDVILELEGAKVGSGAN